MVDVRTSVGFGMTRGEEADDTAVRGRLAECGLCVEYSVFTCRLLSTPACGVDAPPTCTVELPELVVVICGALIGGP
jgi:hypothetical protein